MGLGPTLRPDRSPALHADCEPGPAEHSVDPVSGPRALTPRDGTCEDPSLRQPASLPVRDDRGTELVKDYE